MDENHILKLTRRDDSAVSSGADPTAMAEAALVEQALQELAEIGLCPPEGAYSAFVDIIGCYDFDEHCEPVSDEPEITEKIVYLCQTYNGRKLFTEDGNGIRLSYDKQGLREIEYKWYDIEDDLDGKITLSSQNVSDIFVDYLAEREENSYDTTGPEVYYEKDGVVHPARVFYQGADYTRPVYIDLETNEVLSNEE